MLKLPISATTFGHSFLGGDGSLEISSDEDAWLSLVDKNEPFNPKVDDVADVKVSLGTERELGLGRAGSWKIGIAASGEAGHQIHLIWPGSQLAPGISRGVAPGVDDLLVRLVLHGKADASVKGSVPAGPLSGTFGVAAGGSVGYERLVIFPKTIPARKVLEDLFAGVRLPQQVDTVADIPARGEVLVARFSGYLKLTGQLSYGYSLTRSREIDVGKLSLDLDYQLKLAASVSAAYQLAGNFEIEARAGSSPNFARFTVVKSRESEFNFAADFGLDAEHHLKGLPDSANEFLVKAIGAHAERAVKLFEQARTDSNLSELEKAAGKLLKGTIHDLSQKYIGKALTNATLNEFLTRMLSVIDNYNRIDTRIIHLYEDFLDNILGLTETVNLVAAAATTRDGLKDISDNQAWALITRLAGPRLHDVLMEEAAFAEFAQLVKDAKSFLDQGAKKEIRDLVATFKKAFPLDALLSQLRGITRPEQLKNLADEKLQGLAEQILGKTFDQIRSSNVAKELRALHDGLDRVASFRDKYYGKVKEVANNSFRASLHFGYSRAASNTALLDVEVDVSDAEGRRLAKLASSGDFSELLAKYNSKLIRINKGVFTHSVSSSTHLQINLFGYGIEGLTRVLQDTDEALEAHEGGLLHIYTTKILIDERRLHGGELTASTFIVATVAKAFQLEGTREYFIRTLPKMSIQYDLLEEDNKTKPDEMRQILDFAATLGLLPNSDAFLRQLLQEFPKGLGKVSAKYVIRYDPDAVQAAFQIPDNALRENLRKVVRETMRSFIGARSIGMSAADWGARFGFAYADPANFYAFERLDFARFVHSHHVWVTLPAWFTHGAPQEVELRSEQRESLKMLYGYQEKFLERLIQLDTTVDALRDHLSGDVSPKDLNKQVKQFVEMAPKLGAFRQNVFFVVFDRLVAEGSGGRAPRNSSLVLEITPRGKQTVTKVLTPVRAAPEAPQP